MKQDGGDMVWSTIKGNDASRAENILAAIKGVGSKESLEILKTVALDSKYPIGLRTEAVKSLGGTMNGEDLVLALLKDGKIGGELKTAAVQGLSGAWRKSVKAEAAKYLEGTGTAVKKHPELKELLS